MANEIKSLTDLMKSNARLKKASSDAKKTDPASRQQGGYNDYNGPDGEVVCLFDSIKYVQSEKGFFVILNFTVDGKTSGQAEHSGQRCSILHNLNDTDRQTAAQGLEGYYVDLQLMGIDTPKLTEQQIDTALNTTKGVAFKLRAVTGKRDASRRFFNIIGVVAGEDHDYSDDSSSETDDGEWNEEEGESEELTTATGEEQEILASDYINEIVKYKPSNAPKALEYKVIKADDKKQTLVLERNGKRIEGVKLTMLVE